MAGVLPDAEGPLRLPSWGAGVRAPRRLWAILCPDLGFEAALLPAPQLLSPRGASGSPVSGSTMEEDPRGAAPPVPLQEGCSQSRGDGEALSLGR